MKGKDIGFFLLGTAIGAGITWLFTSSEGKEILAKAKDIADEWKEEIDEALNNIDKKADLTNEA